MAENVSLLVQFLPLAQIQWAFWKIALLRHTTQSIADKLQDSFIRLK